MTRSIAITTTAPAASGIYCGAGDDLGMTDDVARDGSVLELGRWVRQEGWRAFHLLAVVEPPRTACGWPLTVGVATESTEPRAAALPLGAVCPAVGLRAAPP